MILSKISDLSKAMSKPLLYAHRGASLELPENTLEAFQLGLDLGADVIETDIHMSKDGHIIVSHDPSALRMAGENRFFSECTLDEIKQFDAGKIFVDRYGEQPFVNQGFCVPTLEETLTKFKYTSFNVDIKPLDPKAVSQTLKVIYKCKAEERVRIASFHTQNLFQVRDSRYPGGTSLGPRECLWLVFAPVSLQPRLERVAAQIPTSILGVSAGSKSLIQKYHSVGVPVYFWTINSQDEAKQLIANGADGVMTDDPRTIRSCIPQ